MWKKAILVLLALCVVAQAQNCATGAFKSGSWTNIPGGLKYISVDGRDGRVWGVAANEDIYTRLAQPGSDIYSRVGYQGWVQIPGKLKQIAVRNGKVWGVTSNDDIYRRDGVDGAWVNVPGKLIHVAIDSDGSIWGVNAGNNIYYRANQDAGWQQVPGQLKQIDVVNGVVVGVNSARDIWTRLGYGGSWVQIQGAADHASISEDGSVTVIDRSNWSIWYRPTYQASGQWTQVPGGLKQVDHKGCYMVGVNSADMIYSQTAPSTACSPKFKQGQWTQVPGGLKYISVDGADGRVWGVNSNDDIYTRLGASGSWQQIPGKLKQITVRNGKVWGVNSNDDIYRRDGVSGSWVQVPGKLIHVAIDSDGSIWGVDARNNVYYKANQDAGWQQVPGTFKQIDVVKGVVVGVNSARNIYYRVGFGGSWVQIQGAADHASISEDGSVTAITLTNLAVWYRPTYQASGQWTIVPGALKQVDHKGTFMWGVNPNDQIYTQNCATMSDFQAVVLKEIPDQSKAESMPDSEVGPMLEGKSESIAEGDSNPMLEGVTDPIAEGESVPMVESKAEPIAESESDPMIESGEPMAVEKIEKKEKNNLSHHKKNKKNQVK